MSFMNIGQNKINKNPNEHSCFATNLTYENTVAYAKAASTN